jgi:hypothetical protein
MNVMAEGVPMPAPQYYLPLALLLLGIVLILAGVGVAISVKLVGLKGPTEVPARVIAGCLGIASVVASIVVFTHADTSCQETCTPTHTAIAAGPTFGPVPTPTDISPSASLTYPSIGAQVSRRDGFKAGGTTSALGKDTIWVVDYDGGYTVDEEATLAGAVWSAIDAPLGDDGDPLPFNLTMKALLATPGCATELARIAATPDDYVSALPTGCSEFGTVTVVVARS